MKQTAILVSVVLAGVAAAAPPPPTIVNANDVDWHDGSVAGVSTKEFPGELGRMNLVRYAAGTLFPLHNHINEQILMVQSGSYRIEVEGTDYMLQVGDVIIIPSYSLHEVEALEESSHIEFFAPTDLKPRRPE